jgi:hypothetical protein
MWIPKPIYDHAPSFWFVLGILFLAGAVYLSFPDALRAAYYVFATFCFGHATWTFVARRRFRRESKLQAGAEAPAPAVDPET